MEPRHRDVVAGVITQVLGHIRSTASRQLGHDVTAVVLGRPVEFRGLVGSHNDQEAQGLLERAAREAGFTDVEFLCEPAAAALGYHRQSPRQHAALIIDIGGGTTDIAYAQVGGKTPQPVIHKVWGKGFGGTDVDIELSVSAAMPLFGKGHEHGLPLHAYRSAAQISDLSRQRDFVKQDVARVIEPFKSRLRRLKDKGTTVRLNRDIEQLKIDLSDNGYASQALDYIEPELQVAADSGVLENSARRFLDNFRALLERVRAELPEADPVIFMTGGMSRAPYVQACVREVFGRSKVEMGDASLGVVAGLAQFARAQSTDGLEASDDEPQPLVSDNPPLRLMHHGANDWLTEEEVLRRDQRIDAAVASIKALEKRFSVNLYSCQHEESLVPGMPPYMRSDNKHVYGEAWLDKRLDYIEKQVLGYLAKEVLKGIESRPRNDRDLKGSAWSIAKRLCIYRYTDYYYADEPYEFDCDVSGLHFSLHDLIYAVYDLLVNDHMTYKLWNDEALDKLNQYLHYEVYESKLFFEGALFTGVHGRPATMTEFLEGVDEAIAKLPVLNLHECCFPDDHPEQVLFSEYVSAQHMTNEQKTRLYQKYLEVYTGENDVEVPVTTLIESDVRVLLEAVEQAQVVQLGWFVPEGIPAEKAMDELLPVLDNQTLVRAQRRVRKVLDQHK
nr:Hsp70 family protein [Azomonas macrocytogenes]